MTELDPRCLFGDLDLTDWPFALRFGADLGKAEWVYGLLNTQLADGEHVSADRATNRTLRLPVMVEGGDLAELAENTARLERECAKRLNTVTFDPGDGVGLPAVFDTFKAQLEPERDDDAEQALVRLYTLVIPAQPFIRSAAEVVEVAEQLAALAESVLDNCSATTGWSAPGSSSLVSTGGKVVATFPGGTRTGQMLKTFTLGSPYLRIRWSSSVSGSKGGGGGGLSLQVDGTEVPQTAASGTDSWFDVSAHLGAGRLLTLTFTKSPGVPTASLFTLSIDEVVGSNHSRPATPFEQVVTIGVSGTARTQGRLVIEHPSSGLGDVMLFTYPEDLSSAYTPAIETFRTSPTPTADSTLISGGRTALSATPTYTIPADALPEGSYWLVLRARHTSASRVDVDWTSTVAGVTAGGSVPVAFDNADVWQTFVAGVIHLPPLALSLESNRAVGFTLGGPTGVDLDSAWLCFKTSPSFPDKTALTIASAAAEKVFAISPASVEEPRETVYAGDHYPGDVVSWGRHLFEPSSIRALVVTTLAQYPQTTLAHYPRSLDFPAA